MRVLNKILIALAAIACSARIVAAQLPLDPVSEVTRFDVSTGYRFLKANAPPAGCQCFHLSGGYASAGIQFNQWLGAEGQYSGARATRIGPLGQDLTLKTYTFGPRFLFRYNRWGLRGSLLFGRAHASDSYFPSGSTYSTSASSFAFATGGSLTYDLTSRLAIRALDAQYLKTGFPNGSSNTQNHLILGTGIVIKFHGRQRRESVADAAVPVRIKTFSCSVDEEQVTEGHLVQVTADLAAEGTRDQALYSWSISGGKLQGAGRRVSIDTRGLPSGRYVVTARAILPGATDASDCDTSFHVLSKPEMPRPIIQPQPIIQIIEAPQPAPVPREDEEAFHTNVADVLFDYDKWSIRLDGESSIARAAQYLAAHPHLRVMIGGYSDERGTANYNVELGLKRANAVRDRLVDAGVEPDRIRVVSYGKGAQVCTVANEACWQQNRRAAFMIQP